MSSNLFPGIVFEIEFTSYATVYVDYGLETMDYNRHPYLLIEGMSEFVLILDMVSGGEPGQHTVIQFLKYYTNPPCLHL